MSKSNPSVYDCVVIGAGLSGLIAARNLHRSGKSVLLVEARDRIGGRMHGRRLASGQWIDLGGQWVGSTQHRILALLDEYGIRYFPSPAHGRTVLLFNGERHEFRGLFQGFHECEVPDVTEAEWRDVTEAWDRFHALSATLSEGHPVAGDQNQRLDSDTFSRWIEENTQTEFGHWYFAYMARAVGFMGPAEPSQVSLLHVLWGQKSAPQSEHPDADLIHGGAGQLPEKIAAELGDQIRLNEPALCIRHHKTGVEIETAQKRFAARFTIVATPPHLAGQIRYDPPLPPLRQQLTQRIPMGCLAKILISYETPFWREKGWSGMGIGNRSCFEICADSSDPESGKGVLATFVVGDRYKRWRPLSDNDRRSAVLSDLATYFGEEALSAVTYDEADWAGDPWAGGGYSAFMPPGVWTGFGEALAAPVGRIYWAGSEVAERWGGFFEGALLTGEAAATAVLARLEGR
jgi:L-amino acid dehydrogenase